MNRHITANCKVLSETDVVECLAGLEGGALVTLTLQQILILSIARFTEPIADLALTVAQILGLSRLEWTSPEKVEGFSDRF